VRAWNRMRWTRQPWSEATASGHGALSFASIGISVFNRTPSIDLAGRKSHRPISVREIILSPGALATTFPGVISSTTLGKTWHHRLVLWRPIWRSRSTQAGLSFYDEKFRSTPGRVICLPASLLDTRSHSRSSARASLLQACSIHHCVCSVVRSRVEGEVVLKTPLGNGAD